jgi:hypothetical protein
MLELRFICAETIPVTTGGGGALPILVTEERPFTIPPFGLGVVDFGGGGVDDARDVAEEAPAALFIHLPKSGSNTNEFASPSLALIGLLG